jgi:hypothetical protein
MNIKISADPVTSREQTKKRGGILFVLEKNRQSTSVIENP